MEIQSGLHKMERPASPQTRLDRRGSRVSDQGYRKWKRTTSTVFQSFPNAVAIIDSDNDTLFNCWTAERTEIDHETQSATYAALFPTVRKARLFYVKAEKNSPKFTFTLDDDPTPKEGMFYYTDYENCVIEDLEYHGHQCVLWVRKELKNSVPQICINHFADTCGVGVPKHSRDLCRDD
ncbi:uncharacterized protein LOC119439998 isoform X4 [Dermacentor silvarum]|uniref:uncharacterized protein LOC119439998 isoform X4 n=1 Tax=Dermacentor silvarum TaxID=543639 RepID=UPI0021007B49|nr:uncharacterized protein LOC119439998 isoform X4 [Dermacentor silvarum]